MNNLTIEKRAKIVRLLVEGNSLRSTSRIMDVSINTISKVLVEVGGMCMKFHDMIVRNVASKKIQADEVWSFIYSKQKM